jgi:ubiquitin conjugation factor E4 B
VSFFDRLSSRLIRVCIYARKPAGAVELVPLLLRPASHPILSETQVSSFLTELTKRFGGDGLEDVLGPGVQLLVEDLSLRRLNMSGMEWREHVLAFRSLVDDKVVASMVNTVLLHRGRVAVLRSVFDAQLTDMENWDPDVSPVDFERRSLLGPIVRLGVFADSFVSGRSSVTIRSDGC